MATYYNITATIAFDRIEADSPQQAAAKAHALIDAQMAQPERILVWTKGTTATGGTEFSSTAWTFNAEPQAILPPKRKDLPKPVALDAPPQCEVPLPVESEQDSAPLSLA